MELTFDYAGMNGLILVAWIALLTIAGLAARQIVQGKPLLGLWGDMAIGLVGAFAVGWLLRQLDFDLSQTILNARPGIGSPTAIFVDVFVVAFAGALVLRLLLRIAKR